MSHKELEDLLRGIRYDATAIQAKVSELLRMIAEIPQLSDDHTKLPCPECGVPLAGPRALAEHLYVTHDLPSPNGPAIFLP